MFFDVSGADCVKMHLPKSAKYARAEKNFDPADDILIRLDSSGFVVNASSNAGRLGLDLDALLLLPHIADFCCADHQIEVARYFDRVIKGEGAGVGVEFPIVAHWLYQGGPLDVSKGNERNGYEDSNPEASDQAPFQQWYTLSLTRIESELPQAPGALGTLRAIQTRPDDVSPAIATQPAADSITGLSDRREFIRKLTHSIAMVETQSAAIFAIDSMRAIFMQYGQGTADEVRWGFARFLEAVSEPPQFLAQIDEERFGVLLPDMTMREAREWAADALQMFAGLTAPTSGRNSELTASAGIASVQTSAEWTLRQAELGLIMARAGGGMQTGVCNSHSQLASGQGVEKLIERAVEQVGRRMA